MWTSGTAAQPAICHSEHIVNIMQDIFHSITETKKTSATLKRWVAGWVDECGWSKLSHNLGSGLGLSLPNTQFCTTEAKYYSFTLYAFNICIVRRPRLTSIHLFFHSCVQPFSNFRKVCWNPSVLETAQKLVLVPTISDLAAKQLTSVSIFLAFGGLV